MQAMSNAARRDAPSGNYVRHHGSRGLAALQVPHSGVTVRTLRQYCLMWGETADFAEAACEDRDGARFVTSAAVVLNIHRWRTT